MEFERKYCRTSQLSEDGTGLGANERCIKVFC